MNFKKEVYIYRDGLKRKGEKIGMGYKAWHTYNKCYECADTPEPMTQSPTIKYVLHLACLWSLEPNLKTCIREKVM